jgi:predicted oxidoreductase
MAEYYELNRELADYRRLKAEIVPVALKIFMDKSVVDFCKCKNFYDWYARMNAMNASYLYNVYRINKRKLSAFRNYFGYMKNSCRAAC